MESNDCREFDDRKKHPLYGTARELHRLLVGTWRSTGMTKAEVAFCLSLTAFVDILARLLLPTIFDKFGWKKRMIFWVFCLFIGIARSGNSSIRVLRNKQENIKFAYYTVLAEQTARIPLITMFVIAGFLRGATLVNLNLCISECCTLKKLPSAFGIFMVFKGLCVVTISPLIGTLIRYDKYNIIFFFCLLKWH